MLFTKKMITFVLSNMNGIFKYITKSLSLRISLMVVYGLGLLSVTLVAMFQFAHRALKEEAMSNAQQTLEGTVQQIDNVLLSVEQSSGNVYFELMKRIDEPEQMYKLCEHAVQSNPYVVGCAIAFKPDYYPGRHLFMAYVHRKGHTQETQNVMVLQENFTKRPYTEQRWYKEPMTSGRPGWIDPLKNEEIEDEPLATFCLPIYDKRKECVGVMAVDIRIELLSEIVLKVKPSPNGYATLLAGNGSFIVHPDEDKLTRQTVFAQLLEGADASVQDAAEAMVNGEEGEKAFVMNGQLWHVFYKPFARTKVPGRIEDRMGWSVGVVYPVEDIYGDYNRLFNLMMGGMIIALMVLFVLSWALVHKLLKPLETLTGKARRIANGHYDEPLPATERKDEIGQLQESFNKALRALTAFIRKQNKLNDTLKERGEVLAEAYGNVQKNSQVKTTFLHFMTNQMLKPAAALDKSVAKLCNNYDAMSSEEAAREVEVIEQQSKAIVELTDQMLEMAQDKAGKEDAQ